MNTIIESSIPDWTLIPKKSRLQDAIGTKIDWPLTGIRVIICPFFLLILGKGVRNSPTLNSSLTRNRGFPKLKVIYIKEEVWYGGYKGIYWILRRVKLQAQCCRSCSRAEKGIRHRIGTHSVRRRGLRGSHEWRADLLKEINGKISGASGDRWFYKQTAFLG